MPPPLVSMATVNKVQEPSAVLQVKMGVDQEQVDRVSTQTR